MPDKKIPTREQIMLVEVCTQMQLLDNLVMKIANMGDDKILDNPLKAAFGVRADCSDLAMRLGKLRLDFAIKNKMPIVRDPKAEAIWKKQCEDYRAKFK